MMAYRKSSGIASLILNLGSIWSEWSTQCPNHLTLGKEPWLKKKKLYKCISLHIIIISASQTHFSKKTEYIRYESKMPRPTPT